MKICASAVSLSFTLSFEIIPTTTALLWAAQVIKPFKVLIEPKSNNNSSLGTTSIHSSSKMYLAFTPCYIRLSISLFIFSVFIPGIKYQVTCTTSTVAAVPEILLFPYKVDTPV